MHNFTGSWSSEEFLGSTEGGSIEDSPPFQEAATDLHHGPCSHGPYKMDTYNPVCNGVGDDGKFWNDSECCSGDDQRSLQSPEHNISRRSYATPFSPYQIFPASYPPLDGQQYCNHMKETSDCAGGDVLSLYSPAVLGSGGGGGPQELAGPPFVRVVKKRNTANKKERRRTQSINNAYADLRDCIPSVPADTKLSKIKTLRLATSYISYLKGVLDGEKPSNGFCAEIENLGSGHRHNALPKSRNSSKEITGDVTFCAANSVLVKHITKEKQDVGNNKTKGRTGWPEHVWALEFKQEQNL